ncbi:hypothetical protein ACN9ML_29550 [Dyadobacter endophyticus]|uniref:hypothetical protein n=1 Tax=Dyadobacter endophyticus TaxID=1749036 RepID=UPI003CF0D821
MPETTTKYFQVAGPAEIRINANNEPELYFYDKEGQNIINAGNPFVFNVKPGEGRVRFVSVVLLVEADKADYDRHNETLALLAPGITWEVAEPPTPDTMIAMNPIKDPPPPRPGG